MRAFQVRQAGDAAVVLEFGDRIGEDLSREILAISEQIRDSDLPGVIETIPTFRSLLVEIDPDRVTAGDLLASLKCLGNAAPKSVHRRRIWEIPICYEGAHALDLAEVAATFGETTQQIADRHAAQIYYAYMIGFLPGQPYLGEISPGLQLPRRRQPRLKIPAGSVAIATTMTSIFPSETPCGWHVLGRTPIPMWEMATSNRPLIEAGDAVQFVPVTTKQFTRIEAEVASGVYRPMAREDVSCLAH